MISTQPGTGTGTDTCLSSIVGLIEIFTLEFRVILPLEQKNSIFDLANAISPTVFKMTLRTYLENGSTFFYKIINKYMY